MADIDDGLDIEAAFAALDAASGRRLALIDNIAANMESDLEDVASSVLDDLEASLAKAKFATPADIAQAASALDLRAMLSDAGYDEAVEAFMGTYSGILSDAAKGWTDQGGELSLLRTDMEFLNSLAEMDDGRWDLLGSEIADATRRAVLTHLMTGRTFSEIRADVAALLGSSIAKANQEARAMLMVYARHANVSVGEAAGAKWYLYAGPIDGLVRPFCRQLVGLVVKLRDIKLLRNGQIEPPLVHGGGYGCRHHWSPVHAPTVPEGDLPRASAKSLGLASASKGKGGPHIPVDLDADGDG